MRWTSDGSALIVLAADRGLDGGATNGAVRIWWDGTEDPAVTNPDRRAPAPVQGVGRRRRDRSRSGPRDATVWEFDLFGDDARWRWSPPTPASAAGIIRRWRRSISRPAPSRSCTNRRGSCRVPPPRPRGKRIAFLEGWSSDRGLVAGEMRHPRSRHRQGHRRSPPTEQSNITALSWRDDESLWFAGWSRLGSTYGIVRLDGTLRMDRARGRGRSARTASSPRSRPRRTTRASPPSAKPSARRRRSCSRPRRKANWSPVTALNAAIMADYADYPEVREVHWKGKDGLALEALVLLPQGSQARAAADHRRHPWRADLVGEARLQSRLRAARSRPPAMSCSCRTIAAIPAGASLTRGSTSAIPAARSGTTSWPASTIASPRASPMPTGSASPAPAMAAT